MKTRNRDFTLFSQGHKYNDRFGTKNQWSLASQSVLSSIIPYCLSFSKERITLWYLCIDCLFQELGPVKNFMTFLSKTYLPKFYIVYISVSNIVLNVYTFAEFLPSFFLLHAFTCHIAPISILESTVLFCKILLFHSKSSKRCGEVLQSAPVHVMFQDR